MDVVIPIFVAKVPRQVSDIINFPSKIGVCHGLRLPVETTGRNITQSQESSQSFFPLSI